MLLVRPWENQGTHAKATPPRAVDRTCETLAMAPRLELSDQKRIAQIGAMSTACKIPVAEH